MKNPIEQFFCAFCMEGSSGIAWDFLEGMTNVDAFYRPVEKALSR